MSIYNKGQHQKYSYISLSSEMARSKLNCFECKNVLIDCIRNAALSPKLVVMISSLISTPCRSACYYYNSYLRLGDDQAIIMKLLVVYNFWLYIIYGTFIRSILFMYLVDVVFRNISKFWYSLTYFKEIPTWCKQL